MSTADLPATVLALVQAPADLKAPGQTLSRFWSGGSVPADLSPGAVLSEAAHNEEAGRGWPVSGGRLWSLVTDRWHFIAAESGEVELYSWDSDPAESRNVAQDSEVQAILDGFRATLTRLLPGSARLRRP